MNSNPWTMDWLGYSKNKKKWLIQMQSIFWTIKVKYFMLQRGMGFERNSQNYSIIM